jgi:hypothetical protein
LADIVENLPQAVHEVEAKKRQQGGQGGVLLVENLPQASKGTARDKAGSVVESLPQRGKVPSVVPGSCWREWRSKMEVTP